ncbi:4-oxalocrotonate tautomerase family protein [Streptomyces sp. NPDC002795]|uniref:tautomerase family protein n=1 Tax=Streptomyces sp. NPDC002795 TaxID=3364665 RepID=UPI0036ADBA73
MPQITVTLAEGRTPEQIRTLQHEVHEAVLRSIDTRPEYIRIVVHEVPTTHWSTGDTTIAEMHAPHTPTPTTEEEMS